METKICFKCGRELPLSSFYKHPRMGDGHLNKCKDCTKKDVSKDYDRKSQDPEWVEKERARGREKYKRLGYVSKITESKKEKQSKYKGLRGTRKKMKNIVVTSECELHHWNYNLIDTVIVLDKRLHHRLHSVIELNIEEGIYYCNGEALDTIEKHLRVIKKVCESREFSYSDVVIIQKPAA